MSDLFTRPYPGSELPRISQSAADHAQQVVSRCVLGGFVYGPLSARWDADDGAIVADNRGWRPYTREPLPAVRAAWGDDFSAYPPGAACSTFAALFTAAYLDAREQYKPSWGAGMADAVRSDPYLKERVTFTRPGARGWYRSFEWDKLRMPEPVCLAFYSSHVVVALDGDALNLKHPVTAEPCLGVWVLGADGYFLDKPESAIKKHDRGVPNDRDDDVRLYCAQPLTFEPAAERAERQKGKPDGKRKFALIGLKAPEKVPAVPGLIVDWPVPTLRRDASSV